MMDFDILCFRCRIAGCAYFGSINFDCRYTLNTIWIAIFDCSILIANKWLSPDLKTVYALNGQFYKRSFPLNELCSEMKNCKNPCVFQLKRKTYVHTSFISFLMFAQNILSSLFFIWNSNEIFGSISTLNRTTLISMLNLSLRDYNKRVIPWLIVLTACQMNISYEVYPWDHYQRHILTQKVDEILFSLRNDLVAYLITFFNLFISYRYFSSMSNCTSSSFRLHSVHVCSKWFCLVNNLLLNWEYLPKCNVKIWLENANLKTDLLSFEKITSKTQYLNKNYKIRLKELKRVYLVLDVFNISIVFWQVGIVHAIQAKIYSQNIHTINMNLYTNTCKQIIHKPNEISQG